MNQRIFELDAIADGKQGRVIAVATAEGGVGGFAGGIKLAIGYNFHHCGAPGLREPTLIRIRRSVRLDCFQVTKPGRWVYSGWCRVMGLGWGFKFLVRVRERCYRFSVGVYTLMVWHALEFNSLSCSERPMLENGQYVAGCCSKRSACGRMRTIGI